MALPPVLGDVSQSMGLLDEFAIVLAFAFAGGDIADDGRELQARRDETAGESEGQHDGKFVQ